LSCHLAPVCSVQKQIKIKHSTTKVVIFSPLFFTRSNAPSELCIWINKNTTPINLFLGEYTTYQLHARLLKKNQILNINKSQTIDFSSFSYIKYDYLNHTYKSLKTPPTNKLHVYRRQYISKKLNSSTFSCIKQLSHMSYDNKY
jgi:hypothetical protein